MQSTLPWHIGCNGLESTIGSDALRALDSVSGCLESFWASVGRSFDSGHVQHSAAQLRRSTGTILKPGTDHMSWLATSGYSREDIRQIRYVVEGFHGLEPVSAILASLANRWLAREYFDLPPRPACFSSHSQMDSPFYNGSIEFLNDFDDLSCVESITGKHGQPVHAFFRALAVWPEYACIACSEIAATEGFTETSRNTLREAERLSAGISMKRSEHPPWVDADAMTRSIIKCSEVSAEVITAATALRNGFIAGEESERDKREYRRGWQGALARPA